MADPNLHWGHGYGFFEARVAAHRQAEFYSSLVCPYCQASKHDLLNIPRRWWQRLFLRQHKRFICLECEKIFLVKVGKF